jgi:opacity protein-like surface antigen
MRRILLAATSVVALALGAAAPAAAHEPTCVDFEPLGIVVHGQHVVRDYVTGGALAGWPAARGVGQYVRGDGAAVPGGPGPGFHFPNGFAPGASFCTDSRSPGAHF